MRRRRWLFVVGFAVMIAVLPLLMLLAGGPVVRAGAEVVHLGGFTATVDGHRGWYGGYDLAGVGAAWCVDHGIAAPDADYGYVPIELGEAAPPTRTAMAWALGRSGQHPDRLTASALTLVLHDLMEAPYPSGRLDVDELVPSRLSGFEGQEADVLARARAVKADAVAHAHLRGPLALALTARATDGGAVKPGGPGVLVARLSDAAGAGVAGIELAATASGATLTPGHPTVTDAQGEQRFDFVAAKGVNRFEVAGVAPDLQLHAFGPSTRRAQRVARSGQVPISAGTSVQAETRKLSVRKTGDASAYLPLAGARFVVRPAEGGASTAPAGELVTGTDGTSPPLELPPGRYVVTEVAAPAGYSTAGPWTADLTGSDLVLEAADAAIPGKAEITKVDAATGRPLAGAELALGYDADHDGSFETSVGNWESTTEPAVRDLRPGDYEVRETTAPAGYAVAERPLRFSVRPGQSEPVVLADAPLPVPTPAPIPSPPATTTVTEARSAPPLRRLVPEQATVPRLPETGQPISPLGLAGSGLIITGTALVGLGGRPGRRARRRARSL